MQQFNPNIIYTPTPVYSFSYHPMMEYLINNSNKNENNQTINQSKKKSLKNDSRISIPKSVKRDVWKICVGENKSGPCFCCKKEVDILDFHCGHVEPYSLRKNNTIENLKAICALCNYSMGTRNMYDFILEYGYWYQDVSLEELKQICRLIGISNMGNKTILIERIIICKNPRNPELKQWFIEYGETNSSELINKIRKILHEDPLKSKNCTLEGKKDHGIESRVKLNHKYNIMHNKYDCFHNDKKNNITRKSEISSIHNDLDIILDNKKHSYIKNSKNPGESSFIINNSCRVMQIDIPGRDKYTLNIIDAKEDQPININELSFYDVYDDYNLYHFIQDYCNVYDYSDCTIFEAKNKIMKELLPGFTRIIRKIQDNLNMVFLKCDDNKFNLISINKLIKRHNEITLHFYQIKNGEREVIFKSFKIFQFITDIFYKFTLESARTKFIPFHFDSKYNNNNYIFNTFPGFSPRRLLELNEENMIKIKPILDHIMIVFANNNQEYYNYIISWLAYPIKHLKRTQKCLILIGDEGNGKSIIFEFMADRIYGKDLATEIPLERITQQFNSIISNKLLLNVNEATNQGLSTTKSQDYQAKVLRDLVTSQCTVVEKKRKDAIDTDNQTNIVILSNNDKLIQINQSGNKNGERRYPVYQTMDTYCGNIEYFTKLRALMKDTKNDIADIFYSYLRSDNFTEVDLEIVPMTEIKEEMIQNAKPTIQWYVDELYDGCSTFDKDDIRVIEKEKVVWIPHASIYENYKEWFKEKNGEKACESSFRNMNKSFMKFLTQKIGSELFCLPKKRKYKGKSINGFDFSGEVLNHLYLTDIEQPDDEVGEVSDLLSIAKYAKF